MEVEYYRSLITEAREQLQRSVLGILQVASKDDDVVAQDMRDLFSYGELAQPSDERPEQNDPTSYQYNNE